MVSFSNASKLVGSKHTRKSSKGKQHEGAPAILDLVGNLVHCTRSGDLELGRRLQCVLALNGQDSNAFLGNHLIRLFANYGCLVEANQIFDRVSQPDRYTWNAIINAHVKLHQNDMVIYLYTRMQNQGAKPNSFIFPSILKACGIMVALEEGRKIHEQIIQSSLHCDIVVGSSLIDMYSKCGYVEEAHKILNRLPKRNVVSWGALITGYARCGRGLLALKCFQDMQDEGIRPDKPTFLGLLKACTVVGIIENGRCIEEQVFENKMQSDMAIGCTLVNMYSKCGSIEEAQKVFDRLPNQDVASWAAMISGYCEHEESCLAIKCFLSMEDNGIRPDKVIFLTILKACSSVDDLPRVRFIHEQTIMYELHFNLDVASTLINMYSKCGSLNEALRSFTKISQQNVLSWGAIVAGYCQHCEGHLALEAFECMQQEGIIPEKTTYVSILKACDSKYMLEKGRQIHEQVIERGHECDVVIVSALVDMYTRCLSLDEACRIFENTMARDLVLWSVMIAGYAHHGQGCLALGCFEAMLEDGIMPDKMTFLSVIKACSCYGTIVQARCIHEQVIYNRLQVDISVGNSLVNMYAKCGCLEEACKVFDRLQNRDVLSWVPMVVAYAQCCDVQFATECFQEMELCGVKANNVAFTGILTALSRVGLVDEALWYIKRMEESGVSTPDMYHITCMVDLLGHTGQFAKAEDLLKDFSQPDVCHWVALLDACIKQ